VEVTAANRREYVDLYARWVLTESIAKQFEDFKVRRTARTGQARPTRTVISRVID